MNHLILKNSFDFPISINVFEIIALMSVYFKFFELFPFTHLSHIFLVTTLKMCYGFLFEFDRLFKFECKDSFCLEGIAKFG